MKDSKTATPRHVCGDCIHINACSAWNVGNLDGADATNCVNYKKTAMYKSKDDKYKAWINKFGLPDNEYWRGRYDGMVCVIDQIITNSIGGKENV